jgi:hypothetical protein
MTMVKQEKTSVSQPRLCWYQFSLRTLLIIVTIIACLCSLFAVKMRQAREQKEAIKAIRRAGGYIKYKYQVEAEENVDVHAKPYGPDPWREMLGDDFFNDVWEVQFDSFSKVTDSDLEHLNGLRKLDILILDNTQISDAGLEHLEGLNGLKCLSLIRTRVTDTGVNRLRKALPDVKIILKYDDWFSEPFGFPGPTKVLDAGSQNPDATKNEHQK